MTPVSGEETAEGRTQVALDTSGRSYRYYLIWATSPTETSDGFGASISDARLFD